MSRQTRINLAAFLLALPVAVLAVGLASAAGF